MNIETVSNNLKSYMSLQIDSMALNTPIIGFMKPLITRAINKNFSKVTSALDIIADKEGNIDIDLLLSEVIDNVLNMPKFIMNTPFFGDIEIGDGNIKINIPLINKRLVLNVEDLNLFKEMMTNKAE